MNRVNQVKEVFKYNLNENQVNQVRQSNYVKAVNQLKEIGDRDG